MKLKDKLSTVSKIFQIKVLGKRIPLVVTWPITNRCNLQCQYCERWRWERKELTTSQVFSIIDQLKELGTIRISLSGGEPLIRDDIGKIIDYAKKSGISVVLTSNGSLVPRKIEEIKNLDLLKLSIEGEEAIHDKIRGRGSFKKVLKAAEATQKHKIKFVFNSVLTCYNLDQIDFLLNLAEEFKTGVRFTALNLAHAGEKRIEPLYPPSKDYQKAIEKLIKAKKKGRPVLNSFAGLDYFKSWPAVCHPEPPTLRGRRIPTGFFPRLFRGQNDTCFECFAGRAFAHLSADGNLYPCVIMEGKTKGRGVLKLGFKKAFESLPKPRCSGCWCEGTLELNLLLSLKPRAMMNLKRLI